MTFEMHSYAYNRNDNDECTGKTFGARKCKCIVANISKKESLIYLCEVFNLVHPARTTFQEELEMCHSLFHTTADAAST